MSTIKTHPSDPATAAFPPSVPTASEGPIARIVAASVATGLLGALLLAFYGLWFGVSSWRRK